MRNNLLSLELKETFFTPEKQQEIISQIFVEKKADSGFLYEEDGASLWVEVSHDEEYPFYDEELSLLKQYQNDIAQFLGGKKQNKAVVTDIGCGDGKKAAQLFAVGANTSSILRNKEITYIPSDSSYPMTQIAERTIKAESNNPNISFGNPQIMKGSRLLTNYLPNNTYLWLGGTMCNFSDEQIVGFLKNMDNNGNLKGNQILLSYFTPPTLDEIETLKRAYDNETSRQFVLNGINNLGLNSDDFDVEAKYVYDEKNMVEEFYGTRRFPGEIQVGIKPKHDMQISLQDGEMLSLKGGDFFVVHCSRRLSQHHVDGLLKQAGCKVRFSEKGKGMNLLLTEKKAKHKSKIVKYTSAALVSALLLVGAGYAGVEYYKKSEQDKIEKSIEEGKEELTKNKTIYAGYYDSWMLGEKDSQLRVQMGLEQAKNKVETVFRNAFDLSHVDARSREMISLLLQEELFRSDSTGLVKANDVLKYSMDSLNYANDFVSEFVDNHGLILRKLGLDVSPYSQLYQYSQAFNKTLNLEGNAVGTYVTPPYVKDGKFHAPKQNTTPYLRVAVDQYNKTKTSYEKELVLDSLKESDKLLLGKYYSFDIEKELGFYQHSDGTLYHILLVNKNSSLLFDGDGPFVFAAKVDQYDWTISTSLFDDNLVEQRSLEYSLQNGKDIIQDYLKFWDRGVGKK